VEAHCRRKEKERMSEDETRNCRELMGIYREEFVKNACIECKDS